MNKLTRLLCLLPLTILVSCSRDLPKGAGPVDFSDLEEGQISRFSNFTTTCDGLDEDFEFTENLIRLEVIRQDGELYFREIAEAGFFGQDDDELAVYPVYPREDFLLIPERSESWLFFFYANDTIHLRPEADVTLEQDGCLLNDPSGLFIGNDIGTLPSYEVGMVTAYDKTVVSCVPGWMNIDAYLIYDEDALRVSHVTTSGIDGIRVDSWVLVE